MSNPIRQEVIIGDCRLILGDCLEVLPVLGKVDAVVTDPPFGTTQCSWDAVIPFDEMWKAIDAVINAGSPVVLFGCEPFSSLLRISALDRFKYDWVWDKPKGTGFLNAKKQPLRGHELVSVFCKGPTPYYPQKTGGHIRKTSFRGKHLQTDVYGEMAGDYSYDSTERYPRTVITFSSDTQNSSVHPTQKPVALMEYLISTYSQAGQTILDFTMGSGTTGVACVKAGRKFVGVERHEPYFDIACDRIRKAYAQPDMLVEASKPVHEQGSFFDEVTA
ncbi:site-specific DNA-methyltransferase [Rhizobium rhizogenes]|uniref:Methyltransferase n=1 Tax=Rhizobium rhizogenes TaxID=359 RepID=A0AA88JU76_RHIRH|nr:site-specific DNA-methyltransferase [Rhizobium rhizogenes]KAA3504624.1 site-specific DNA-methyltransferase [Rhizobium rhizogenes]